MSTNVEGQFVSPNDAKLPVSSNGFRIVELYGKFTIQREFEKPDYEWFLFWIIREKKRKVWKNVNKTGNECFTLSDNDMLPEFDTIEEAEKVIEKFINAPHPIYHYR